jgi:formate hydrogenlyase subunit 6/NADH:ubiquinone oxidoreductase subunit I
MGLGALYCGGSFSFLILLKDNRMSESSDLGSKTPRQTEVPPASAAKKKKKSPLVAIVHPEGCTGCEVCIEFCPVDCIYKVPGPENPEEHRYSNVNGIVVVDEEICIGCKLCAKYCPWETIDMVRREEELSAVA